MWTAAAWASTGLQLLWPRPALRHQRPLGDRRNYCPTSTAPTLAGTPFTLGAYTAGAPADAGRHGAWAATPEHCHAGPAGDAGRGGNNDLLVASRPVGSTPPSASPPMSASQAIWSGDFGRVIVNAGRWLDPPPCATGSATPTVAATATPCPGGALSPWTFAAPYQGTLESAAMTTDGIYAMPQVGRKNVAPSNLLGRYDPVANSWTYLATMPAALYDARGAYAATTNSIYVFGGYNGSGVLNTTYIYNSPPTPGPAARPCPPPASGPTSPTTPATARSTSSAASTPASPSRARPGNTTRSPTPGTPARANVPVAGAAGGRSPASTST